MLDSLARRTLFAAVLLAACNDRDPLDSVTAAPASAGPTGSPSGEPENMSEGTGTSSGESSTTGDPPTGTGVTEATLTGSSPTEPETTTEPAETTTGGSLSHAVDIQPIWDANCVTGCHRPGGTAAAWFILSSDAYANIVGQPSLELATMNRVEPGSLENSYLWHKINDTHIEVGGSGSVMPPPPVATLPAQELATIAEWIEAGCAP